MSDCIFCKIAMKEIPAKVVYEDEHILAFHDIQPAAPSHVLVIPKEHIPSMAQLEEHHKVLIGHIHLAIQDIAVKLGIHETGYRIVNNCGEQGGQTVHHLHFHLLGGRHMQWPPG
ncbi:MAG: histidine triad nucleotide-binding protein [Anaerosolibacter sp.]|uniref:histidine triad nucleotide-binding protein n=1 Tax=Anaerosolibacter sp. TaxID=1872527 RepID=UPI0026266CCE|nr:histidine triad nucleotide-binding protein [Anaerosolibacter sp.]MDF2548143.1 histidine triad nucleotide-binding protein [Anaerosolibacter sp.]